MEQEENGNIWTAAGQSDNFFEVPENEWMPIEGFQIIAGWVKRENTLNFSSILCYLMEIRR